MTARMARRLPPHTKDTSEIHMAQDNLFQLEARQSANLGLN
jgi:hypothetical protein